jgi:hypothetical protein
MPSPMLQMGLDLLVHGLQHFINGETLDRRLAILHLDQAVELTLKERLRAGGKQIMKPGRKESISLIDAYDELDKMGIPIFERTNLDLLHEERNNIQHLFASPDDNITRFHLDNTLSFFARFLSDEFAMNLLDYIPDELLSHEKLKHIEDIDKLRLIYESAESAYRSQHFLEGITSLVAAVDLTLQISAQRKQLELTGINTVELLVDANNKRVITRRAIIAGNRVMDLNTNGVAGNFPNENDFLALLARFRQEAVI